MVQSAAGFPTNRFDLLGMSTPTYPNPDPTSALTSMPLVSQSLAAEAVSIRAITAKSATERSHTAPSPHLFLFDGLCPLCHGSVRLLLALDSGQQVCFAPLQGPTARRAAERLHFPIDLTTAVYVRDLCSKKEKVHFESSAVLRAIGDCGALWWGLATFLRLIPRPIRNAAYRFVASRRFRWYRPFDTCPLPKPEHRGRFLP